MMMKLTVIMNYVFRALLEREENKDSLVPQVSRWVRLFKPLPEVTCQSFCMNASVCLMRSVSVGVIVLLISQFISLTKLSKDCYRLTCFFYYQYYVRCS